MIVTGSSFGGSCAASALTMTRLRTWSRRRSCDCCARRAMGRRSSGLLHGRSGRPTGWPWTGTGFGADGRHSSIVSRDRVRQASADADALIAVWTEVDRLPERQRAVFYLRYRADLAFDDIGEILGIDASSARGNASRGLATLRSRLAGRDD